MALSFISGGHTLPLYVRPQRYRAPWRSLLPSCPWLVCRSPFLSGAGTHISCCLWGGGWGKNRARPAAGVAIPRCVADFGKHSRLIFPTSGVRGGRSGALKNVQGHVVSRDTWCPRRAVRERRRPSQDSWPSWDSTVLGQRKCPGTKRGVLGQPTPSQDGDCPGHRVSRDTFASRTPFASQDTPPDPQRCYRPRPPARSPL